MPEVLHDPFTYASAQRTQASEHAGKQAKKRTTWGSSIQSTKVMRANILVLVNTGGSTGGSSMFAPVLVDVVLEAVLTTPGVI